ncbi:hypothetical protein [Lacticaseibacillus absianus]|uniref:hypothetical protein n=1 Tax=Lacticaseibacillus absianus TaxID=2729623 RepID=UPI0015CAA178|nr:hypothetical protein [Lacticaseibacillus absianus]
MNKYLAELIEGLESGAFDLVQTTLSNREGEHDSVETVYSFMVKMKNPTTKK